MASLCRRVTQSGHVAEPTVAAIAVSKFGAGRCERTYLSIGGSLYYYVDHHRDNQPT